MLLETGDKILAHSYERDSLFACGMNNDQLKQWEGENVGTTIKYPQITVPDDIKYIPLTGKGKNLLGVMCMQVYFYFIKVN